MSNQSNHGTSFSGDILTCLPRTIIVLASVYGGSNVHSLTFHPHHLF